MSILDFLNNEWHKWDKAVENLLSEKLNLRGITLEYVNRKDDAPVKIMFDDIAYDMDPEDYRINAAPLTGAVFNIDNTEVHKFLKPPNQVIKAWKWIEKSKVGRYSMKDLRENYDGFAKGERHMNIMKADLKELYFKRQAVLT